MKLRRALAAAAATAVMAPLALLSAPAAFADETDPEATPSTTPSTSAPEATPENTPETAPETTESGTTESEPESTPTPSAPTGQNNKDKDEDTATSTPTETSSGTPSGTPSMSEEPPGLDPEVPFCEELDEEYSDAKVSAAIKGLPGKIVAGSGDHPFQLVVTNGTKADLDGVVFYAEVENYELDEDKWLSPFVDLEFKNPEDGKWTRIGDDEWAGDYFFHAERLKAGADKKIDLRIGIDAKAPAGDAYSFGSGAYLDEVDGQECFAEGWAEYEFTVLKPGSANPDPGEAEPDDDEKADKGSAKQPQGDMSELPGNLAETGADSALPVIGLVGGAAVVVGAGAVFLVRRRKGEGEGEDTAG
ncbi:LAETG motif-containing sortase-dependent surface protein [Streptomyces sp. NPDC002845]